MLPVAFCATDEAQASMSNVVPQHPTVLPTKVYTSTHGIAKPPLAHLSWSSNADVCTLPVAGLQAGTLLAAAPGLLLLLPLRRRLHLRCPCRRPHLALLPLSPQQQLAAWHLEVPGKASKGNKCSVL